MINLESQTHRPALGTAADGEGTPHERCGATVMVWPDLSGFILLVVLAIAVRWAGGRLLPLIMPPSRLASLGVGVVGGLAGHFLGGLLWPQAPRLGELHLPLALVGATLFIVLLGLVPFLRLLLGKTPF